MMPMYRYMDSHPEQKNQTFSFPQYPYPPHQPNPPMAFVPWPYGGNFGYPNPVPCYSCCNHGNVPGYNGFRPSYPQTPMPSPVHFAGGYPAPYHEAYPVQYVPPPHYSMELPQYDYDKKMPGNYHCCGCPNHSHENKGVKIEEQESPDVVEKVNDSLVPGQMTNYPYPVVWIPPGNMKGEEQRKLSGPESAEQKKNPDDHERPPVSLKSQEGDQRRGLLPFDLANIGSLMQGGNGERVQDQRSEDRKKEFPFPIFWMPSYDNKHDGAGKKDKDMDASQDQQTEERMRQLPFPFFWFPLDNKQKDVGMEEEKNEENRKVDTNPRIVPTKHAESSDNGTGANEDKSAGLAMGVIDRKGKDANQRVIPVKQMDLPKKEDNSEDAKRRGREVPVKHVDDNLANKPSGSSVRSQSSSPKKSSKLPPVCLRVDPLPSKMKNGGGSSRSPSPPGHKKVQKETSADTSKASASFSLPEDSQQNMKPHNSSNGNEVEPFKKEKVIDVMDKGIGENNDSMHASQIPVNSKEVSSKPTVGEAGKDGNQCEVNEDQGTGKIGETTAQNVEESGSVKSVVEGSNFERKMLSDVAAAVLIQSAYRGFMVRRWEPLKKLKQMAEIREQVADIRNQIISLETSDLNKNDKQRVVIGETIMRLLLRLDTIQGLLPSLRDIRRSLARELVLLQEKLDDIMSKKSQDTTQEVSSVKTVEELNANGNNSVCMSEQQADEAAKDREEFPAAASDNSHVATEPCQGQVTQTMDSLPGVEVEVPELSEHKELDTASENGQHELPGACDLNSKGLDSGPTMEWKDNIADGQLSDGQAVAVDAEMANGATEFEQCGEAPSPVEDTPDHSVVSTASEVTISPELLQVAVNTEPASSEPENVEASEMSKDEMKQGGEVELTMSPDITSPIATDDATEKEADMHELAALQLGTTDEDSGAVSELKKNKEVHMVKENDVSKSGEEEIVALQQEGTAEELTKLGGLVDEEHTGDKVIDPEVEHHHKNEAAIDDHLPAVSQMVESQPLSLPVETSARGVVHENRPSDLIDGVDACLPTVVDADTPNEDEVEKSREAYKDLQAVTIEDDTEMKENKAESEDSKEDVFTEKSEPLPADAETAKEDVLIERSEPLPADAETAKEDVLTEKSESLPADAETAKEDIFTEKSEPLPADAETSKEDVLIDKSESLPADAETAKEDVLTEKSEPLPASPIATEVSSGDGSVVGDEGARKLIKENEKLRETMQKLMVEGKDQLQVISDLTGRVKDLEKKLAKKKKLRTKRCRAASSRSSCVKPSSNHLKERTGVAM